MFAYGVFKVIYAPHKAFKEIVQNPKYIGPVLVMILYVLANVGFVYTVVSKTYVEQILPDGSKLDQWTENRTGWTSSASIVESNDSISGGYYGNKSIEASAINATQIWMQLDGMGQVNCTGATGYKNVSFRIKLAFPNTTQLTNASLDFSSSPADYFQYDLTQRLTGVNNTLWQNLTAPIGPGSPWRSSSTMADWDNITQLKFEFEVSEPANLTVLVDGLFFRGVYKLFSESSSDYILRYSLSAFMQFFVQWFIFSGLLFMITKAFKAQILWKPVLIVVGFALITLVIQTVISTVTYATLPALHYPLEVMGGTVNEFEKAYQSILDQTWLVSQISGFAKIVMYFWTIILAGVATRLLTEFSWTKSLIVSVVAYIISIVAQALIFGI